MRRCSLCAFERFRGTCGPPGVQEPSSPSTALGPAGTSSGEPALVRCLLPGPPSCCVTHCGQWWPPPYC
ncbi:KRTCAP3 isoform 3 [Pongo abelii]|uniref:KRTCAP3 isoform 3 n=1 Tax=Pongo abelii TaxID=9601 RepID=A0A2J8VN42_PONAB|nr:KRTCAP3 isoform 3 [Pongo abelii]